MSRRELFGQHLLQLTVADAVFAVPTHRPQNYVTLKMFAFEWIHVLLRQQKMVSSLPLPDICNCALYGTFTSSLTPNLL